MDWYPRFDLIGQTALVTGAARGLGREISLAMANAGADVALGLRDPAGVEHGCTMLRTADELYQLVGSADPLIKTGARLTVRGRPNPNLITTCQQGIPLQVVAVQA